MLETCINQAAGLQKIALQASPKVIAMASHGDQQGELPLLWSLCSTLVDAGYSVMVLDANAAESEDNPGLLQLLDDVYWHDDELDEPMSWSVLPAALGFQRISTDKPASSQPLASLYGLLQNFAVIVIYGKAESLVRLLPMSGVQPLLTVSPFKGSPVTAYQALKQLLLNAGLRPTVANIVGEIDQPSARGTHASIHNLQECAMTFLGYQVEPMTIQARQPESRRHDDMHRLAMRLLENAMPLQRDPFVRSH
jgi:hypothetical protein